MMMKENEQDTVITLYSMNMKKMSMGDADDEDDEGWWKWWLPTIFKVGF